MRLRDLMETLYTAAPEQKKDVFLWATADDWDEIEKLLSEQHVKVIEYFEKEIANPGSQAYTPVVKLAAFKFGQIAAGYLIKRIARDPRSAEEKEWFENEQAKLELQRLGYRD